MGRKRNQGKVRRAKAKARQETEERGNNNQITSREKHPQVEQLRTRQFQFQIGNRDCSHGLENFDMSPEFVKKFVEAFHEARDKDDKSASECVVAAQNATMDELCRCVERFYQDRIGDIILTVLWNAVYSGTLL